MTGRPIPTLTRDATSAPTDSTIAIVAPDLERAPGGRVRPRPPAAGATILHVALIVAGVAMVFPFVWMLITSFKTLPQLLQDPRASGRRRGRSTTTSRPGTPCRSRRRTSTASTSACSPSSGTLLTASMAGYAFARIKFRGSRVIFIVFLATQMIPKQVTLIPFYLLMSQFGWVDSHLSLIVPAMIVNPFAVFLMRQFVLSLPKELEEAALVDGAGPLAHLLEHHPAEPEARARRAQHHRRARRVEQLPVPARAAELARPVHGAAAALELPRAVRFDQLRAGDGGIRHGDDPDADRLRDRPAPNPEQHGRVGPRRTMSTDRRSSRPEDRIETGCRDAGRAVRRSSRRAAPYRDPGCRCPRRARGRAPRPGAGAVHPAALAAARVPRRATACACTPRSTSARSPSAGCSTRSSCAMRRAHPADHAGTAARDRVRRRRRDDRLRRPTGALRRSSRRTAPCRDPTDACPSSGRRPTDANPRRVRRPDHRRTARHRRRPHGRGTRHPTTISPTSRRASRSGWTGSRAAHACATTCSR